MVLSFSCVVVALLMAGNAWVTLTRSPLALRRESRQLAAASLLFTVGLVAVAWWGK